MTEIKLCGIRTLEQARAGVQAGADYLGFVFAPVRRYVAPEIAREIVQALGHREVRYVGVFVDPDPEEANRIAEYAGLDIVQLHGSEAPDVARKISRPVFKAIKVRPGEDPAESLAQYSEVAEMLLLDTYSPRVAGGTGHVFDWRVASGIARTHRIMLAGGLTVENVREAIATVRPAAVDVSSGIETNGEKDLAKMAAFVRAAREAQS